MISAIQPAGTVLIVKIIFMLITGTCFVNGQYVRVARCVIRVSGYELRVTGSVSPIPNSRAGRVTVPAEVG
jgi:hypothetical protein